MTVEPPRRASETGSVLVVVLLIILALTGIGLIGLSNSTHELRASANYRFTKQGTYVGEAAMMHTLNRVGQDGETYVRFFKLQRDIALSTGTAVPAYRLSRDDVMRSGNLVFGWGDSSACGNPPTAGEDGCQGFESESGWYGNSALMPNFAVTLTEPLDGPRAPGFGQNFCFKRFTFDGAAWVGGIPAETFDWRNPGSWVFSRTRAQALVGPLDCSGGYYGG